MTQVMSINNHKLRNKFYLIVTFVFCALTALYYFIGKQPVQFMLLFSSPILILALFAVHRSSHHITSSLSTAMNSLDEIGSGNFSVNLENIDGDETGNLLDALKTTSGKLKNTITPLGREMEMLCAEFEKYEISIKQHHENIENQQQLMTKIFEMNTVLPEKIGETLAKNIEFHAGNMNNKLLSYIDKAKRSVETESHQNDEISTIVHSVGNLKTNSDSIGGIADSINKIASQTNLLALNAAIEAARAGEQGRGFSVVADEIRALAGLTQDATSKIQAMISKIQTSTGSAVSAIEQLNDKNRSGALTPLNILIEIEQLININSETAMNNKEGNSDELEIGELESMKSMLQELENSALSTQNNLTLIVEYSDKLSKTITSIVNTFSSFK